MKILVLSPFGKTEPFGRANLAKVKRPETEFDFECLADVFPLPYNTYAPAGHISLSISDCNKLLRGYMKRGGYYVGGFDGTNGRNYARTHINTGKGWAYMICTNVGGNAGKYAVTAVQNWINANFK